MVETFLAQAKAARDNDKDMLKLLDNPVQFMHGLIKQRLMQRSENCLTPFEDLDGLVQSRKEAYEKSETIHWTSRPKTAEEKVPETRERISTAPPNLSSNATNDVKALKQERSNLKERYEKAAMRVRELKERLKALQEDI